MASQTLPKLPVIDFTMKKLKPGTDSWLSTRSDVRRALEEYGSFVAVYDKVSSELNNGVFGIVKELFDLPTEIKAQNICEKLYIGYVGDLPNIPIHESLGIENATTLAGVQSFTNLMWPSGNYKFCESILEYAKHIAELEQVVSKMVFESYGVERHYDSHLRSTTYLLRPVRYRAPEKNESNVGGSIHTDKSFVTILRQNQVQGLQIQARNGDWISVDFPPEAFVVIVGDAYMAWSNGRILSPNHQVILRQNKTRYIISVFSFNKGTTHIPEEMVDEEHPLQFGSFDNMELLEPNVNYTIRPTFRPFDNMGLLQSYLENPTHLTEETARRYCGIHA